MTSRRYSSCSYCGSAVEERHIRVETWIGDTLTVFEDVPAGVCSHCGEEYLGADTQEKMFALTKSAPRRTMDVPVYGFTDPLTVAKAAAKRKGQQPSERAFDAADEESDVPLTSDEEISKLMETDFEEWEDSER
ncbi:MAG: type II toxin-antitoxin system MqsA family antitoxin [Ignavibacteriae bacterium]|nr:type II toxin-antitoxin system MqsA family antitoxin [Ignavibacteriota bacterium]